ncbi:AHH domain-containing protein [Archangium lansingense]|uniref:AHH domain-containing protein n=1 Tax=Archangium lansingense TaxID=2995310 RepID=A0ABT4ALS6_9BACT|nr:AHH domain-containing protein [Archangium lansinium]MCY1082651.1 AHH domain-containing protein [Archangium lansinium]
MSDNKKGHFGDAALSVLHNVQKNTTENGACLTGHLGGFSKFRNKSSCNYRYQAYERAKENVEIKKRLQSYKARLSTNSIETSAYPAESESMTPAYYCARLPAPQAGDWDVTGPNRVVTRTTFSKKTYGIPIGHNFTQDTWPYWNNAHHLIPKGTLKERILEEDSQVSELMQKALLKAKYNINHKFNMLLMPQDREVAELLDLPRHIQLKDDDEPDLAAMCTDHPAYNEMVREMDSGLDAIIQDYKEICDQKIEEGEHDVPDGLLDKARLESLSKRLLRIILDWGSDARGGSLEKMSMREKKKQKATGAPEGSRGSVKRRKLGDGK